MTFKVLAFAALVATVVAQEHKGHATSYSSLSFYPTSHGQSAQATHYAAPAVAHYAAAPAVAHYAAAPAVAHYAAPAVHYAAPEVHAVKSLAVPVYHKAVVPVKAVEYHHEEEPSAPAHYIFKYAVHDEHTHDIKEQEEKREGDKVEGFYSLIEPDGSKRTVHYTADKHSGFNAVVQREHNVHAPAPVHKKIAVAAVPVHKYVAAAPVYHAEQASHAPVYHAAPVYQAVKVAATPVYHQAVKVAAAPLVSYHAAPAPAAHSGHGEATSYISFSGPVAPAHH